MDGKVQPPARKKTGNMDATYIDMGLVNQWVEFG